jgi:hypothetical protein
MLPSDFLECAEISDLPARDLRCLAECVGVQAVMRLWDKLGGRSVAFPRNYPHRLIAKWLRKRPGISVREAAFWLGVSERTISRVMNAVPAKKPEQMSLF